MAPWNGPNNFKTQFWAHLVMNVSYHIKREVTAQLVSAFVL